VVVSSRQSVCGPQRRAMCSLKASADCPDGPPFVLRNKPARLACRAQLSGEKMEIALLKAQRLDGRQGRAEAPLVPVEKAERAASLGVFVTSGQCELDGIHQTGRARPLATLLTRLRGRLRARLRLVVGECGPLEPACGGPKVIR